VDAIEQALVKAKAEHAALDAELKRLQDAEQGLLDEAREKHAKLTALKEARRLEHDALSERLRELVLGRDQALSLRKRVRLVRNVLLRGALGTSAFLGWLMAATSDWSGWLVFGLAVAEAGAVWWLSDYADHQGMRDE
jgi:hypothetical protein